MLNIMSLDRLCEILTIGNSLIQWDEKTKNWMVSRHLMDIMDKKA